jgi:diaminopimelate epimerase
MVRFHKMHGLGNDFVIFDGRETSVEIDPDRARFLGDRRTGIGCDQIILIEPSETADVSMRIWNSDGSEVEACGNASRCVTALIGGGSIETKGGLISGSVANDIATMDMGEPLFGWDELPLAYPMDTAAMPVGWAELQRPFAVRIGNPHVVFFIEDVDQVDLAQLGPQIETDPLFPEKINVNIASVGAEHIRVRTWERGAGLTLACGTGSCAVAVAAISRGLAKGPVEVVPPGGALTIDWSPGRSISMTGPCTPVFTGEIDW